MYIRIRKKEICSNCGELRRVEKRNIDKSPICDRCYRAGIEKELCSICEKMKVIEKRHNNLNLCGSCSKIGYVPPKRKCSLCGEIGVIRNIENNGFICVKCYEYPKQICIICGRNRRVNKLEIDGPVCGTCYKSPKKKCFSCQEESIIHGHNKTNEPLCNKCYTKFRRKNDEKFYITSLLRNHVTNSFRRYSNTGKLNRSVEYGIDYEAIFNHLGLCPGLREDYHIDHIIPLSAFDFNDLEQIKLAFSPDNHQWLKKEDNLKKSAKYNKDDFDEYLKGKKINEKTRN